MYFICVLVGELSCLAVSVDLQAGWLAGMATNSSTLEIQSVDGQLIRWLKKIIGFALSVSQEPLVPDLHRHHQIGGQLATTNHGTLWRNCRHRWDGKIYLWCRCSGYVLWILNLSIWLKNEYLSIWLKFCFKQSLQCTFLYILCS